MSKIRVLHIYRTYFPETQGGGQEAIRQLSLATQAFGVENTVFALAHAPRPAELHLPEARLVRSRSWLEIASCDLGGPEAFLRCREVADECDIIQIHYPWPFADLMLPFIHRRGQPVVVTYVSDIVRQRGLDALYAPLRRNLLRRADRIVVSSVNYAKSSEVLQGYQEKLEVIPHCLGDAPELSSERVGYWEKRLGRKFFLFVGVLRYYKGLDFLIEAARLTGERIVVVGDGPEGDRLKLRGEQAGGGKIHFLGALPDMDRDALFSLCRGVVFPSHLRSEAFGMALLEGAREGKPLICCEISTGTTAINVDGVSGYVVPPADPAALAKAIDSLAQDDVLCARLGAGARRQWEQFFTPQVVGEAYYRLYQNQLANRPSGAKRAASAAS